MSWLDYTRIAVMALLLMTLAYSRGYDAGKESKIEGVRSTIINTCATLTLSKFVEYSELNDDTSLGGYIICEKGAVVFTWRK